MDGPIVSPPSVVSVTYFMDDSILMKKFCPYVCIVTYFMDGPIVSPPSVV